MNKDLKKFILAVLLVISTGISAQTFGIRAGYINSAETGAVKVDGFQVGPVAEFGFANKMFGIQYGVIYNYLARKYDGVVGTNYYTGHLLDVPVRLKIGFPVMPDLTVFAAAGPKFNFGLAQHTVNKTIVFNSEVITDIDRYKTDINNDDINDLKRFDVQAGIGGGIEFRNIQLLVEYDWGLLNLDSRQDKTLNRNQLSASIVYAF